MVLSDAIQTFNQHSTRIDSPFLLPMNQTTCVCTEPVDDSDAKMLSSKKGHQIHDRQ